VALLAPIPAAACCLLLFCVKQVQVVTSCKHACGCVFIVLLCVSSQLQVVTSSNHLCGCVFLYSLFCVKLDAN
jgi:hypothetical protein